MASDLLPRIDLVRRHVLRLSLTSVLFREVADFDSSGQAELVDTTQHVFSGTQYRRSGQRHVITAQVTHDFDVDGDVRLDLSYDAGPHVDEWTIPKEARRESHIVSLLSSPWKKQIHSLQVDFVFQASEVASTFIALPLGVPLRAENTAGVYVTSVSGLVQDADTTFGVELRRFDDEGLIGYVLRLYLSSEEPWDNRLLVAFVDRAWVLTDGLITLRSSK